MRASDHAGSASPPEAGSDPGEGEQVAQSGSIHPPAGDRASHTGPAGSGLAVDARVESGVARASTGVVLPGSAPESLDWDDGAVAPGLSIPDLDEMGLDEAPDVDEGPDPHIGTIVSDRYVVDELIGEGGMGKVYRAHHKVIGKQVALKILHAELAKDKEAVGRFLREAKAASSIGNPHIIDVLDFGEAPDGAVYFAMEYLDGGTLGDVMAQRGALDVALVTKIARQLCDGLAAAHRQQIVHRDLKPDNVTLIVDEDEEVYCKLLDFGIAKVSTSASSTKLTMAGAVFGTPHYMSPEQAAGDAVDRRTDIYSLGVMLYEMVAGQLPFHASNFMGILTQHMYKAPPSFAELQDGPEIPRELEAIILKCLSKKPEARYPTMEALAGDLERFETGEIPDAVEDMMARSGAFDVPADYFKSSGRHAQVDDAGGRFGPKIVAAVGVLVAVGVVLFVLVKDATSVAQPPVEPTAAAPPEPTAATTTAPMETAAAEQVVEVLLHAKPDDAVAMVRGVELTLPTLVPVKDGEPVTAEIRAQGHKPMKVEIDGKTKKVSIELEPSSTLRRPVRPRPYRKKSSSPSVDGVVDPWEK